MYDDTKQQESLGQVSDSTVGKSREQAIHTLVRSCSAVGSKQQFLDHIVRFIQEECQCECVGIRVLGEDGYIPYHSYIGFSREFWEEENFVHLAKEDCICTRLANDHLLACDLTMINSKGSYYCSNFSFAATLLTEEDLTHYRGICVKTGFQSAAMIPIRHNQEVIGIIHMADTRPDQITNSSVQVIETISPLLAEVLSRDKIEATLKFSQKNQAMLESIVEGIHGLAYIIDVERFELIYISPKMSALYGQKTIGQSCVGMFDQRSPWLDCLTMPASQDNSSTWDHYDEQQGLYYKAEQKVIKWLNNRTVKALIVTDVTQQKREDDIRAGLPERLKTFQVFFTNSRDIMMFVDQSSGQILEANPAAEAAYGYSREELLNKTIFDLRTNQAVARKHMDDALKKGISFEVWHRRKDGRAFPVEVNSKGETIGGHSILFSVVRDITERKEAEAALEEANLVLEQKVAERTRELQDINAALEEEIMERQQAQAAMKKLNSELEEIVLARTRNLQSMNRALEQEISQRQQVNEALTESKERYRILLQQSAEAIIVSDFETKEIIEVNYAFSRLFGYAPDAVVATSIFELGLLTHKEQGKMDTALREQGFWSRQNRRYRRQDGKVFYAEMRSSLIGYLGKYVVLFSLRDLTERQKLQMEIQEQVRLARVVQNSLLPSDFTNDKAQIRTIFQPATLVSGDFYGYRWSHDGQILHGYLIDVTGHGIAAALHTSAISSLLNEVMDQEEAWTLESLNQLNHYLNSYFQDHTFAALVAFTFDFRQRKMTCVSGGINYALLSSRNHTGIMAIPGIYFGVTETPEFEFITMPFQYGDTFYFMTDGIYEHLLPDIISGTADFDKTMENLQQFSTGPIQDDCSAIGIQITGLRKSPCSFEFSESELPFIRKRIRWYLERYMSSSESMKVEIVLEEALMNAVKHSAGIFRLKINRIGSWLVLRVRDQGGGFGAQRVVEELRALGEQTVFERILEQESGRGIAIMLFWARKIVYNKLGNEVMLVFNCRPEGCRSEEGF